MGLPLAAVPVVSEPPAGAGETFPFLLAGMREGGRAAGNTSPALAREVNFMA